MSVCLSLCSVPSSLGCPVFSSARVTCEVSISGWLVLCNFSSSPEVIFFFFDYCTAAMSFTLAPCPLPRAPGSQCALVSVVWLSCLVRSPDFLLPSISTSLFERHTLYHCSIPGPCKLSQCLSLQLLHSLPRSVVLTTDSSWF